MTPQPTNGVQPVRIDHIEVIPLIMPFKAELAPHLVRSGLVKNKNQMTLYRVELASGAVGYGDRLGAPDDVSAFIGTNAVAGLRQIRHPGIQMACFDAVGHALDLPAHALMGRQLRSRVPFAYWTAELPPSVWASQAAQAAEAGYRVYKFKCRPWWDPVEQIKQAAAAVPPGFSFWLDFNGHLRQASQALPVLKALSGFDCVGGFESPIPQRDGDGYRILREKIDRPIAAHYGSGCCHFPGFDPGLPATQQISRGLCDAFVLGSGDIELLHQQTSVAAEAHMPFWIQTIGTGLRAAWVAHLASTCQQATLSSLAAHTIWQRDLTSALVPQAGWLKVPQGPGLGIDIDRDALDDLRQGSPIEQKRHMTVVVYPDGSRWHFSSEEQRHQTYYLGSAPGFVPGVRLETLADDNSADFKALYHRCQTEPVITSA